jgi:hypothetical protein
LYGVALPQGFDSNKVWFLLFCFVDLFLYSVFVVILFVDLFRFLTSGIRALSLADIVGKSFLFLQIFFSEKKKRGPRHSRNFWHISVQYLQKQVVYLSSSQKNTQVEKKNRPKRSPGSQDIEVLKSAIFQGFFRGRRRDFLFL